MGTRFEVGDVVRLTGESWARMYDDRWDALAGNYVEIEGLLPTGEPTFNWQGRPFAIYNDQHGDFSATLVRKADK